MLKKWCDVGFSDNISKFSYFRSGVVDDNRMELYDDGDVRKMIRSSQEVESMNLYVIEKMIRFLIMFLLEKWKKRNRKMMVKSMIFTIMIMWRVMIQMVMVIR